MRTSVRKLIVKMIILGQGQKFWSRFYCIRTYTIITFRKLKFSTCLTVPNSSVLKVTIVSYIQVYIKISKFFKKIFIYCGLHSHSNIRPPNHNPIKYLPHGLSMFVILMIIGMGQRFAFFIYA